MLDVRLPRRRHVYHSQHNQLDHSIILRPPTLCIVLCKPKTLSRATRSSAVSKGLDEDPTVIDLEVHPMNQAAVTALFSIAALRHPDPLSVFYVVILAPRLGHTRMTFPRN